MKWDDLRIFLVVARNGSISGAARQLGIQHSTVSRRMRQLEEQMGVRLLDRKQSGYELTQAGQQVRDAAQRMENEVLAVDGSILGQDAVLSGPLRVTAINNMASSVLMPIIAEFSEANPRVELHLIVSNDDISLSQREADVAIRLTNNPGDTLIGKRLVTVASTIYGNLDYVRELHRTAVEPRWIGVECCAFHRSWTRQSCTSHEHGFYSDDTLLTQAAIRAGLGVSYLPCFMGDADPDLARYCNPDPGHDLGLWLLMHPDLRHTARVLAFRDHMINGVGRRRPLFDGSIG